SSTRRVTPRATRRIPTSTGGCSTSSSAWHPPGPFRSSQENRMSRTSIAAQTLPGAYPTLPVTPGSDVTEVPADVGNGNLTPLVEAKTIVVAHNINVAAKTI